MKNKYKLGIFVQYSITGGSETGVISGIFNNKNGFSYEINEDTEKFISESDIMNAYRPIVARAKKITKTSKKPIKKSAAEMTAN